MRRDLRSKNCKACSGNFEAFQRFRGSTNDLNPFWAVEQIRNCNISSIVHDDCFPPRLTAPRSPLSSLPFLRLPGREGRGGPCELYVKITFSLKSEPFRPYLLRFSYGLRGPPGHLVNFKMGPPPS